MIRQYTWCFACTRSSKAERVLSRGGEVVPTWLNARLNRRWDSQGEPKHSKRRKKKSRNKISSFYNFESIRVGQTASFERRTQSITLRHRCVARIRKGFDSSNEIQQPDHLESAAYCSG